MGKKAFKDNDGIPPWVTAASPPITPPPADAEPVANIQIPSLSPTDALLVYRMLELGRTVENARFRATATHSRKWHDEFMRVQQIGQRIFEQLPTEMQDELVREDEQREAREREEY